MSHEPVSGTAAAGGPSGWQGARPIPALATLVLGLILYFGLPTVVSVPDAKFFTGQPAAAKPAATAPAKPAAKPAAPTAALVTAPAPTPVKPLTKAQQEAKAKAEAEAKAKVEAEAKAKAEADAKVKAEADAKAKADAEVKRKADWVRGLHLFAIFVTTIVGIIVKALPMGAVAMIGIAITALVGHPWHRGFHERILRCGDLAHRPGLLHFAGLHQDRPGRPHRLQLHGAARASGPWASATAWRPRTWCWRPPSPATPPAAAASSCPSWPRWPAPTGATPATGAPARWVRSSPSRPTR